MQEVKTIWSCMSCLKGICSQLYEGVECRIEGQGVTVTAVCPVWMKKGMFDRGLIGAKKATKNFSGMVTPDVVAKKAVSDADKGKDMSVYGLYVKMCHLMAKVLPQKVMMKVWLMQQK